VEAAFPHEHFDVISSSENGTYHVVRTKQRGFTTLDGKLDAVVHVVCIFFYFSVKHKHLDQSWGKDRTKIVAYN